MSSVEKKPKYTLDSKIKTKQVHLQGLTIQEIIDRDVNGDNIMTLLQYRRTRGGTAMTSKGVPYGYFEFDDEVNASLDIFLYANPDLLKQFPARFTRGELKLKIKEIEASQRIQAQKRAIEFQRQEQEKLENYIREARANLARQQQCGELWGAW